MWGSGVSLKQTAKNKIFKKSLTLKGKTINQHVSLKKREERLATLPVEDRGRLSRLGIILLKVDHRKGEEAKKRKRKKKLFWLHFESAL